jgi:hypothetical protein
MNGILQALPGSGDVTREVDVASEAVVTARMTFSYGSYSGSS